MHSMLFTLLSAYMYMYNFALEEIDIYIIKCIHVHV